MTYEVRETGQGFAICLMADSRELRVINALASREEAERTRADLVRFNNLFDEAEGRLAR